MTPVALIGPVGWPELVIIFFIVLIVFGPRKLPEVAEAMGKSIQKFKKAARDAREDVDSSLKDAKKEEQEKRIDRAEKDENTE
jgi:sec-independent protein translocase protein TatA